MKKLQGTYPVFSLTNGGNELYYDVRLNSLEEALKLCLEGGLQGIVSKVKGIFKNPGAVSKIKDSNLSLFTYGQLNNVLEAMYMQHLMGIDGVIVDLIREISEAISSYNVIKWNELWRRSKLPGRSSSSSTKGSWRSCSSSF